MSLSAVQKALAGAGALFIAATWVFVVVARPTDWSSVGASSQALITLGGYVTGAVLLLVATVPALPARLVSMIPVALVLNIVVGQIIGSVGIPLYLDSTGTVLVAALAGPWAGIATGVLSSLVWSAFNPSVLPFAATSAAVGGLAGVAIKHGALKNIATVLLSGAVIGIVVGMLAAPVAAFVYGGTAGVGTGAVVSLLREMGHSLLQSVTLQSFISDPLDKALVMLLVWLVLKSLPKRTLAAFR
ncbi:ECF transporter S component [Corynebacterium durum]|uniref:ECF transporter S component n=2 Tax=Corynebacterium durum TaxID=61592 RepID=UPI0026DAE90C|nr:ECF transporter S component [Corynebacterium durum]MDO4651545.1 ECF transporter S component [Corynebacterium durum]